jgi:3-methyladenine DNA glycosylase Mpg
MLEDKIEKKIKLNLTKGQKKKCKRMGTKCQKKKERQITLFDLRVKLKKKTKKIRISIRVK